jgi:hypothetical protein
MIKLKIEATDGVDLRKQLTALLGGGEVYTISSGNLNPVIEKAATEAADPPKEEKKKTTSTKKAEAPKEEVKKETTVDDDDDDEIEDRLYSKDEIEDAVIKVDNNPAVRDLMKSKFDVMRMSDIKPSQQVEFLRAIREIKPLR